MRRVTLAFALIAVIGAAATAGAGTARAQTADDGYAYISDKVQDPDNANWTITITYDFTYPTLQDVTKYVVFSLFSGVVVGVPSGCTNSPNDVTDPQHYFWCAGGASGAIKAVVISARLDETFSMSVQAACDPYGLGFPITCFGGFAHPHDQLPVTVGPPPDSCDTATATVPAAHARGGNVIAANDQTCKKLHIWDVTDPANAVDITGKTRDAVVGQHKKLEARYDGGGTASGVTWTVAGLSDPLPVAVKTYTTKDLSETTNSVQAPTALAGSDLSQTDLDFFWVDSRLGETVSVSAPGAKPAQASFSVRAPSYQWDVSTCSLGINNRAIRGSAMVPPALALGFNDVCTAPGILSDIHVTAPSQQGAGQIAVMQVVVFGQTKHNQKVCMNNPSPTVDALPTGLPFYPTRATNEFVPRGPVTLDITSAGQQEWKSLDAPEIDLPELPKLDLSNGHNALSVPPAHHTYFLARTFQTYLMYRPAGDGNLWVPLAHLGWRFAGSASWDLTHPVWTLDPGAASPVPPPAVTATHSLGDFPVWSGHVPGVDPKCNVLGPAQMGALLTGPAPVGAATLAVDLTDGMHVGDVVVVNLGAATEEQRIITALTPLTLNRPLRLAHTAGEPVVAEPPGMADTTPPSCQVQVSPALITGANHQLVSVTATVTAGDDRGGTGLVPGVTGVTLAGGTGAGAISGFVPAAGSLTATGQVRADPGATYTVTYQVSDRAGNTASCGAAITVPAGRGS